MARGQSALTGEQARSLAEMRQRWLRAQASTEPADRAAAETGVAMAYESAGLQPPERIEWCSGPRDLAAKWRAAARGAEPIGRNVRTELFDTMFAKTVAAVERACGRPVRQAVAEGLRLGRPGPLGAAVVAATLQTLDEPIARPMFRFRWWRTRGRDGRGELARLPFRDSGYSVHEVGWLGTYQFLHDACGAQEAAAPLAGLWQIAANMGWIVPHERICWLAERHHVLQSDANERLHCANGPALAYRDGTTLHVWKGVIVPAILIEQPARITPRLIDRELDPVIRRCMIDIMTPAQYIASGSPVRYAEDDTGVLWRKLWWGFDAWAAVEVVNGTAETDGTFRHYFLQVPPTVRTAREAVAWTYGLSEHQYAKLRHRT